ncbi:DUF1254 domain-containing protein [Mycolicibacterium fortuitum]|jgi:hypothetical protein|uniref:Cell envelope protein n=3 Tax=Actinomycetes TaxID=1760 RepID=K0V7Y8_MYCFO|nr:DUF1254 domain-containing protein [Mycolicibacterium fortuitum]AIY45880.1 putative exported protein [Mycobacterium sp. VKM Ac-1817D]CRL76407.1 hypothetical protein CPGR_01655 [Mycolicibacter nonchromogenicus]ALI25941.1 putative exported protein [Mycolicibacterium fortuitum]EJZ15121.1 hypothetical protein MFORT_06354 [Mycolicibacterium fortuitum subsp. fortuitum DSM 46621 = ATCC 6841 = JCM 6387]NOP96193.1 DUF1254 domain-containing protein [Mycolicibacterium fortuitum]
MRLWVSGLAVLLLAATAGCNGKSEEPASNSAPTPQQVREIAKEAYTYGFPMVDNYRIQHSYFVDKNNPQYKGDWNQAHSISRVFTPADTTIQTPNSDTPYTMLGADLRAEPLVLTVPPIDAGRYFSLQFVDGYTYDYAYVGSRTTGNGGGKFLLAGPGWSGEKPDGINEVIRSDTDFSLVIYRTQLFDPADIDNVKKIQSGYTVQPLSAFENKPAATAPAMDFVAPLSPDEQRTSPKFFQILNFVLKSAPVLPDEKELRERFATIGIGPDGDFDPDTMSKENLQAVQDGMADAWAELSTFQKDKLNTGEVTSGQLFGTHAELKNNYLYRMAGSVLGIYGNVAKEAMYPVIATDSTGAPLTGAGKYTLRFAPGQLPPVNSFWSITMYKMPQSLLVANPINRYLINSPMLPELVRDPDGGITIQVQNQSPGPGKEANWLPAPEGPFQMILRLYWPKEEALNGTWKAPSALKS